MDNQNNKKPVNKKGSIFSFIAPYIFILLIVIGVIYFFGGNSNTTARNYGGDVGNFTTDIRNTDYDYESIKVSVATEVVTVTGIFTDTATDIVYNFTLVADKSNRDAIVGYLNTYIEDGSIITYDDYFAVSIWEAILPYLILGAISIVVVLVVMSRSGGSANAKAFDFGKTPMKNIENSKVRFTDVAGCDEEKAELVELVDYLKNPRKFAKMGARIPKGVLLEGAPGTGKTLLAKAVAGEAGVPFFSISGSDFVEMFVGVGASRVRDMFKKAQQYAPSMLFIDEIDAVGRQRGTGLGGGHDEREQTLNQLLAEMDGFPDNAGIIVIAATNRPDVLDPALLRPGRFDRRITVNLPDRVGRTAILKVHARNKKFAADVDFTQIAMRTPGFSGAELENVLNEAAILAVRQNQEIINMNDIDEAIDRVMGGPAKKSKIITPKEKKLVAYHEAGHAIVGLKLENAMKVQKVTIIPRGDAGGYVLMTPNDDRYLSTKTELLDRISGLLAGRVSEEIFFGDVTTGASSDIESATKIARAMVCELGMSSLGPIQFEKQGGNVFLGRDYTSSQRNFSGQVAYAIDQEIEKIMNSSMDKARAIIEEFKEQLTLVAETLLTQETLTNEEVVSLVNNGHLPVQNGTTVSPEAASTEVKPSEETKN